MVMVNLLAGLKAVMRTLTTFDIVNSNPHNGAISVWFYVHMTTEMLIQDFLHNVKGTICLVGGILNWSCRHLYWPEGGVM